MRYRTSHYRTKIRYIESQLKKESKKTKKYIYISALKEWPWVTHSVGLALVKLQLGDVEHYPVKIQHPANKN